MRVLTLLLMMTFSQNTFAVNHQFTSDSLNCKTSECKHFQEIADINRMSIANQTADKIRIFLPWITALLVAFISALVTWKVSMKQIQSGKENIILQVNAANISNKRQEWIDNLRTNIAGIIKNHIILVAKLKTGTTSVYVYQDEEFKNILELVTLVDLSLNPTEEASQNLMSLLRDYTNDYDFAKENSFSRINTIIRLTQAILKNEWIRVKNNE